MRAARDCTKNNTDGAPQSLFGKCLLREAVKLIFAHEALAMVIVSVWKGVVASL